MLGYEDLIWFHCVEIAGMGCWEGGTAQRHRGVQVLRCTRNEEWLSLIGAEDSWMNVLGNKLESWRRPKHEGLWDNLESLNYFCGHWGATEWFAAGESQAQNWFREESGNDMKCRLVDQEITATFFFKKYQNQDHRHQNNKTTEERVNKDVASGLL